MVMGLKGICRFFTHRIFEAVVVILLILFLPHLPPYTNFSESYRVRTKSLEGKLALNERLNDAEIWHKGDLVGPEAFAEYNGELYTGIMGGDIVKLTGNHITPVAKLGKPCKGFHQERICGRPLGMEFDKNGALFVADAYYGIFKVNVNTGEKELIVSMEEEIEGRKPKLPNHIALAKNGDIFWSDSSTEFYLENGIFDSLADGTGRLIHYVSKTRTNKVLIDKIHFSNGIVLVNDEEFVIVAETVRNRIQRYHLKGPKAGTSDIFIDELPGMPDNLRSDGKGGVFVPLVFAVDADHPLILQVVSPFPLIRKFIARVFGLTELAFESLNRLYPCEFAQRAVHFIGHFTSFAKLINTSRQTILHVSNTGEILECLHCSNKKIDHISDVFIFKDTLYLGSPFNDYIARIPLSKLGWEHFSNDRKRREAPVEQPKPARVLTTTQRPQPTPETPPTKQHTTPPLKESVPKQQSPSPNQQTPSPNQQTPSPKQPPPSPKQPPPLPKQPPPSPKQQTPTTQQQTRPKQTPLEKQAPPPMQHTPPPNKTPPKKTPPSTQTPSKHTPPPKPQTTPKQQTTPPQQQTAPPQQKNSPPQQKIPPPQQKIAPPQQQTPPPKQTPSKPQTPNSKASPPKQQTPPVRQQDSPTKQPTPTVAQPVRDQAKSIPVKETT